MMTLLWIGAIFGPVLVALLAMLPGLAGRAAVTAAPFAALPALVLALVAATDAGISIPWLFLGTRLQLDLTAQVFLAVTATVWLAAGMFGRGYLAGDDNRKRFWIFFLLSMAGNFGLIVAADVVTFYVAFALMTFAAYGLVVHVRSQSARRAGRVYLVMSILGEMCILAGMLFTVSASGTIDLRFASDAVAVSENRNLIVALFMVGFGVKVGLPGLHMWLPLAHPVAPTPASAVLSGCMIKAGLLGWLRFLPLEEVPLTTWGSVVIGLGLLAAFSGVVIGLLQDDPKTLLAYSSISQMGLITIAVGVGFLGTDSWDLVLAAIIVYVLHHSLAKGALFLGVGVAGVAKGVVWMQRTALAGIAIAALAMAGAPLTSGALAKTALKDAVYTADAWLVDLLLPLTSVGTTLLMARFVLQMRAQMAADEPEPRFQAWLWLPWVALVTLVGAISWILPWYVDLEIADPTVITLAKVWSGIWPVLVGVVLFGGAGYALRRVSAFPRMHVPAGDLIILVGWLVRRLPRSLPERTDSQRGWARLVRGFQVNRPLLDRAETELSRWRTAGIVMMVLILFYLFLLDI